jgi:predicted AlkP superfamily pyrophosphatase or phosphodiesterase
MKKTSLLLLLLAVLLAGAQAQRVKHVVLITVDGFRPDFYLDTAWHTHNIRGLMQGGFHAKGVTSVFPSVTYPSHTTIITGVQPAQHGVFANAVFEPQGNTGKIYWNDTSIHATTIWAAAHSKGLTVASVFWPVSAGAPVEYNIPDIGGMGEAVREANAMPAGFVTEVKQQVFTPAETPNWGKDQHAARIAAYIIQKARPALMTVHFFSVDHAEHVQGRNGDMVKAAIADADEGVGIIVNALKQQGIWDSTVIIVTGDHGFLNVTQTVQPNVWLKQAGLIEDIKTGHWRAQFFAVGGSAFLFVKDTAALAQVNTLLASLPDSAKSLFRVISKKQLLQTGANPAAVLALSGLNGAAFSSSDAGPAIGPGKGGTHGYYPEGSQIQTGFVAFGPGIAPGGVINNMYLRDIAPTVAKMLGFTLPAAQGTIPVGLFK